MMEKQSTILSFILFAFSALVSLPLSSGSVAYTEFNGFDYVDNGANWTWEQVKTCATSTVQSPLDMLSSDRATTAANQYMFARYSPSKALVRKYNTTIVATASNEDGLGYLYFNTVLSTAGTFRLDNIRFRTPSEHTINGHRSAMEVQLFHVYGFTKRPINEKVVIALLFEVNDDLPDDPFLSQIIQAANDTTTENEIDISNYLTMDTYSSNYFYYLGSLTYPYCSGNHNWVIIDKFYFANSAQINAISSAYIGKELSPNGNYRQTVKRVNRFVRYNGDPTNPTAISNLYPAPKAETNTAPVNTSENSSTNQVPEANADL